MFATTDTIDSYLEHVAAFDADRTALLLDGRFEFIEHPNLFSPSGSHRDRDACVNGINEGRKMLTVQHFKVDTHNALADGRVLTMGTWTGELASDAGPLPAGTQLMADIAMLFTVEGGLLVRQENWDCYHAPILPG